MNGYFYGLYLLFIPLSSRCVLPSCGMGLTWSCLSLISSVQSSVANITRIFLIKQPHPVKMAALIVTFHLIKWPFFFFVSCMWRTRIFAMWMHLNLSVIVAFWDSTFICMYGQLFGCTRIYMYLDEVDKLQSMWWSPIHSYLLL